MDGLLYTITKLKVNTIIIGRQYKSCHNYEEFIKIAKEKKINIKIVESGDRINIENNVYIDVLWPCKDNMISENHINNNSLVCKIVCKNFSILCTGDIEEIAEKAILSKYKYNLGILKSDILKVAHHGSKTSSTLEFLNTVKPKYAIIGVGKKNKFGHPSNTTIQNLKLLNIEIYRTDEMGEIAITINDKKIRIKKCITNY